MVRLLTRAMLALLVLDTFGTLGGSVGWQECSMNPEDRWVPAGPNSLPARLLEEYHRRYTCVDESGSFAAASYTFESNCTSRTFTIPEVQSCLKGRRVIFLGDSLAVQQGDSLLGMLGWNAGFLRQGDPRSRKWATLPDGSRVPALYECWRQPDNAARGCERCYDVFGCDFPPGEESFSDGRAAGKRLQPRWGVGAGGGHRRTSTPEVEGHKGIIGQAREWSEESTEEGGGSEGTGGDEGSSSVHMRMFSRPNGDGWLGKVLADFNETRASDIFVINFGAHFPGTAEGEEDFKLEVSRVLEDMATLGERATVVWREISPTHFPGIDGSYETFQKLPRSERHECCDGTPPPLLERNVWVENYLKDNGLVDRVKLLQIYHMSVNRGSAHRSCHMAPPTTAGGESQGVERLGCPSSGGKTLDCRHWSETGVVEEWNKLMLNHLCPAR